MRQAILITAYRDLPILGQLVDYFDDDFELFIHLDCRCHENCTCLAKKNVHLYRWYAIEWGDWRHLQAIVRLMYEAYAHSDLEYFHLITGSDYPIPPLAQFKTFCESHRHNNYVEHFPLPHSDWGTEGGLDRICYYWLRPNTHRSTGGHLTHRLVNLQRRLGLRRSFSFFNGHLYGGSTYWSVSREAVGTALNYLSTHPAYLHRFRWTSIAEEICLPTLWYNLKVPLINNYMRYIDWGPDGANPRVLTEKDYDRIVASDALFARKMQSGASSSIIEKLSQQ